MSKNKSKKKYLTWQKYYRHYEKVNCWVIATPGYLKAYNNLARYY